MAPADRNTGSALADRRVGPDQRQDLHLHRSRHQRRGQQPRVARVGGHRSRQRCPRLPAQPTVTRGDTQISVAFVAPANDGSTITGYTAACTSSDGGTFGNHAGGTSPIVVTGLTNGKTYTCTVFATNAEGNSAPSAASAVRGSRPRAERTGPADRDPRQRLDLGRVHRADQTVAARSRATPPPARRATAAPPVRTPARRHRSSCRTLDQRQDLHVHRVRLERRTAPAPRRSLRPSTVPATSARALRRSPR